MPFAFQQAEQEILPQAKTRTQNILLQSDYLINK